VLNKGGKFGAKIFSHYYTDIVIFILGYFNLAHPVDEQLNNEHDTKYVLYVSSTLITSLS